MAGTTVKYFAYPFGLHRHPLIDLEQVLQESGYRVLFQLSRGLIRLRQTVSFCVGTVQTVAALIGFQYVFHGNYDGVRFVRILFWFSGLHWMSRSSKLQCGIVGLVPSSTEMVLVFLYNTGLFLYCIIKVIVLNLGRELWTLILSLPLGIEKSL